MIYLLLSYGLLLVLWFVSYETVIVWLTINGQSLSLQYYYSCSISHHFEVITHSQYPSSVDVQFDTVQETLISCVYISFRTRLRVTPLKQTTLNDY
jgi:hypothetical protein